MNTIAENNCGDYVVRMILSKEFNSFACRSEIPMEVIDANLKE